MGEIISVTVQGKCPEPYNGRMETITLNKKQQRRAEVLAKVVLGGISKTDAGDLLGLGRRQINRLNITCIVVFIWFIFNFMPHTSPSNRANMGICAH